MTFAPWTFTFRREMRKLSNVVGNVLIFGALYAIGIALWVDIIRSGFITPELVGKIITGVIP